MRAIRTTLNGLGKCRRGEAQHGAVEREWSAAHVGQHLHLRKLRTLEERDQFIPEGHLEPGVSFVR